MNKNTTTEIIELNEKELKKKYGLETYLIFYELSTTKLDHSQENLLVRLMDELLKR